MVSKEEFTPAILCAESIALLYHLHPVPSLPQRNTFETPKYCTQGYALSLEEEMRVADSLAYLCNDSEDVNHIPALCVEQHPTTSTLNVLLAANSGNGQDQRSSLQRIQVGLQNIVGKITAVDVRETKSRSLEHDIFDAIVSMCSKRILLRLRLSQKQRGPPKASIQRIMISATNNLKTITKVECDAWCKERDLFNTMAKRIVKAADAWTKHQTNGRLKELVDCIHRLKSEVNIEMLFHGMANRDMDPSMRKGLLNTTNKIARYREIARCLHRLSRKDAMFRKMRVITISLPIEAFKRLPRTCTLQNLQSFLPRAYRASSKAKAKQCRLLIETENPEVNKQFTKQVQKSLTASKVHAEIQLLYYLELHSSQLPPRVVASSKDACFLCNAFISMHGKLHTTRTHNRLYPGWRLPSLLAFSDLEHRFNQLLASEIAASIATLLSRGEKTVYPDPNESTLLTIPHSSSTVSVHSRAQNDTDIHPSAMATQRKGADEIPKPHIVRPPAKDNSILASEKSESIRGDKEQHSQREERAYREMKQVEGSTSKTEVASRSASTAHGSSLSPSNGEITMVKGQISSSSIGDSVLKTNKLRLFIESPVRFERTRKTELKGPMYQVDWLDDAYVTAHSIHKEGGLVDAEILEGETTYELDTEGCIHIAASGDVVRFQVNIR